MRKVEFRQQGPPAKRRNWMRYWRRIRADLVTECMKKKKKPLILSGDFRFRFSAENECPFSFRFRPQTEFRFHLHFRLRPKMKKKILFGQPLV